MTFPKFILIPTLTITTLGVLILGWVMMGNKQPLEMQNTTFTTQQVVPTITVSGSTETMTTIDPNTCMTTEIPACKKRFWKDFDEKTCKQVTFEVDCMFYNEVSTNQEEYSKLLSEYGLDGREQGEIACSTIIETININGNACTEEELGNTKPDTNTKGMCRDNSRTCRKVMRDGKEVLLREKNLATRYDPNGKTEICDGRDNDCDGLVDEGYQQKEYLRDFDGDGWGNIEMKTKACFPPPGHVLKPGDCDDLDKEVYPGANEVCDAKDNNCNRQIDEYLVDCNEEVKECKVMLPLGGNDDLGGNYSFDTIKNSTTSINNETNTLSDLEVNKKIISDLVKKYPQSESEIYNFFNSLDITKSLLDLYNFDIIKNSLYFKNIIESHSYYKPENTFIHFAAYIQSSYIDQSSILSGILIATKYFPQGVMIFYDEVEKISISEKLLEIAVLYNPFVILGGIEKYKDKSYGLKIIELAGQYIGGGVIAKYIAPIGLTSIIEDFITEKKLNNNQINALYKGIAHENNRAELVFFKDYIPKHGAFDQIMIFINSILEIKTLLIGKKIITLDPQLHTNLFAGLIKTYSNLKKGGNKVTKKSELIKIYEENLSKFISAGKNFSSSGNLNTFIVRADKEGGDDDGGAFTEFNNGIIELYQCLGKQGTCIIIRSNKQQMNPDDIIALFAKQIHDNPNDYHLFHLGGHGGEDGTLHLAGGNRNMTHFHKLFNLQVKYPSLIRIDISSCNSKRKDRNRYNNKISNISVDSSQQVASSSTNSILLEAFEKKDTQGNYEADYDDDGVVNYHEALIYRAINYNFSLTPIMFDDNGKVIDIVGAEILPQDIQDRSDRENDPFVDTQCSMDC